MKTSGNIAIPAVNHYFFAVGAQKGIRTPTSFDIRPSSVHVCQFRHLGSGYTVMVIELQS